MECRSPPRRGRQWVGLAAGVLGAALACGTRAKAGNPGEPDARPVETRAPLRSGAPDSGATGCTSGATEPCALIPNGCEDGVRPCASGVWGACVFNNPAIAPPCTTKCVGGPLSGDNVFARVNRFDALRADWAPSDLAIVPAAYRTIDPNEKMRAQALGHMVRMLKAQRQASAPAIYCGSAYRSFESQCQLFAQYAAQDRCAKANTYSAMAGHSEHQLGTVCDLVLADNTLTHGNTPADAWLAEHAYEYGYLQSYPADTTVLTGYETEPWHFRYLGVKAALLHHRMEQASGRSISTHEFIATVACWPAAKLEDLAAEEP